MSTSDRQLRSLGEVCSLLLSAPVADMPLPAIDIRPAPYLRAAIPRLRRGVVEGQTPDFPLPLTRPVAPWNKGRFIGPKPPFKPKQVWAMRLFRQCESRDCDLALLDLGIDSKLRDCDLVRLRVRGVALNGVARHRATVVQQKTARTVQFELTPRTRERLAAWLAPEVEPQMIPSSPAGRDPAPTSAPGSTRGWSESGLR